jgi:hypothetical protein
MEEVKTPVHGTLDDKSPTNERGNSRTHSAGTGYAGLSVKIDVQAQSEPRYQRLMICYQHAATITRNISATKQRNENGVEVHGNVLHDLNATFFCKPSVHM